jgi:hypothetical protein
MKVCILSCLVIPLPLKAGYTMILTVNLQFAKNVFGMRPFSDPQNDTTQIISTVIGEFFTVVLYVQVAIFL